MLWGVPHLVEERTALRRAGQLPTHTPGYGVSTLRLRDGAIRGG